MEKSVGADCGIAAIYIIVHIFRVVKSRKNFDGNFFAYIFAIKIIDFRQHRTIIVVKLRSQIFRQIV